MTKQSQFQLFISRSESGYLLQAEQLISCSRGHVFRFFADANNLETITPPFLHFKILSPPPIEMTEGTLIDYSLRVHGIPMVWKSEIAVWEPPYRFVDQQLRGPYRQWIHEHTFHDLGNDTLVQDSIYYKVPGGSLIHALLVRRDLLKIFNYRARTLEEYFTATSNVSESKKNPSAKSRQNHISTHLHNGELQ